MSKPIVINEGEREQSELTICTEKITEGTDEEEDEKDVSKDTATRKKKYRFWPSELLSIVCGVRQDCNTLLQHFTSKASMRFQVFAQCWREMLFSHIFSGRADYRDQLEFSQEILVIVVNIFAKAQDMHRKVGALYMLYGVYMKVPQENKNEVYIRVTPATWAELIKVRDHVKENNHHDALFVFYMLFHTGAFLFVATDSQMAPELRWRFALDDASEATAYKGEPELPEAGGYSIAGYLEDGGLQQLSTLHKKYEAIKQQVFKGDGCMSTLGHDSAQLLEERLRALAEGRRLPDPPAGSPDRQHRRDATHKPRRHSPDKAAHAARTPSILSARDAVRRRAVNNFLQGDAGTAVPSGSADRKLAVSPDARPTQSSDADPQSLSRNSDFTEAPPVKRQRTATGRGRGRPRGRGRIR